MDFSNNMIFGPSIYNGPKVIQDYQKNRLQHGKIHFVTLDRTWGQIEIACAREYKKKINESRDLFVVGAGKGWEECIHILSSIITLCHFPDAQHSLADLIASHF